MQGGSEDPPRKFLKFITQKDAFLRPLSPVFPPSSFLLFILLFSLYLSSFGSWGGGGKYNLFPLSALPLSFFFIIFSSLFLSLFSFFSPNSSISFFFPSQPFPPPPYHGILENINPCYLFHHTFSINFNQNFFFFF